MSEASLVICPEQPACTPPSIEDLAAFLTSSGMTGAPLNQQFSSLQHRYMAGERFLELIAFLGCSPNIKLEPDKEHQKFCHVDLYSNLQDGILFRHARQTTAPRCPGCRQPFKNWQVLIDQSDAPRVRELCCPECGHRAPPWEFDWRKTAGFGQCFIEINDIYPKEALPQPVLLEALVQRFSMNWTWFYLY